MKLSIEMKMDVENKFNNLDQALAYWEKRISEELEDVDMTVTKIKARKVETLSPEEFQATFKELAKRP